MYQIVFYFYDITTDKMTKVITCQLHILWILLFSLIHIVNPSMFTSIERLQWAMELSNVVSEFLNDYILKEEERLHNLKRLAESINRQQRKIEEKGIVSLTENPVDVFLFSKLYGEEFEAALKLYTSSAQDIQPLLNYKNENFPSSTDLEGSIDGLARLQGIYEIKSADIANGRMHDVNTDPLSVQQCYDIGTSMLDSGYTRLAVEWYQTALSLCRKNRTKPCLQDIYSFIETALFKAKSKYDHEMKAANVNNIHKLLDQLEHMYPDKESRDELSTELADAITNQSVIYTGKETYRNLPEFKMYEYVCRGESFQGQHTSIPTSGCSIENFGNPLLMLNPSKMEILSLQPFIVLYHEVFSEKETNFLIETTKYTLQSNEVYVRNKTPRFAGRVSSGAAIHHNLTRLLHARLDALSSLKTIEPFAEPLQIVNYGTAGQYVPHYDWYSKVDRTPLKNRYATMLLYLSDVKAGGATAFLMPGISVPPKRWFTEILCFVDNTQGDVLMWLNLENDLQPNLYTLHAGCPVIVGSKWIANKWIMAMNQDIKCYDQ